LCFTSTPVEREEVTTNFNTCHDTCPDCILGFWEEIAERLGGFKLGTFDESLAGLSVVFVINNRTLHLGQFNCSLL